MTVRGTYEPTFTGVTHALAVGMLVNADYPFMLSKIVYRETGSITIEGRRGETKTLSIQRDANGREFCELAQAGAYERLFNRPPTKFKLLPFKSVPTKGEDR